MSEAAAQMVLQGSQLRSQMFGVLSSEQKTKLAAMQGLGLTEALRRRAAAGRPILGICGGLQALNVAFGGTLIQDLTRNGVNPHQQNIARHLPWHEARIVPNSMLARIMGAAGKMDVRVKVNSTHHQAVKELARGLVTVAVAMDGVIEAIEHEGDKFIVGVQWHPEMLFPTQPEMAGIFKHFIRAAKKSRP